MMFLIRTAFWISVILLVLPLGGSLTSDGPSAQDRASIDAMSALAAAGATVSDMRGFCERQPGACDVGSQALKVISERAVNGAAMLHDYLGGAAPAPSGAPAAAVVTPAAASSVSRDTLTPADRKPAWRAPAGRAA
jgi:hypothetical protein